MSGIKSRQMSAVQFSGWLVILASSLVGGLALPGWAEIKALENGEVGRDRTHPATTLKEWIAQIEAVTVQVNQVNLNRTERGLEIVLQTAEGKPLQVDATQFRREGNTLIADIPNAVLALPERQPFTAENPTDDIASVQVVQQTVSGIRVSVTGKEALPTIEVTLNTGEVAYSLNPEADEPDEEIVVTGEQNRYRVPNTSTATRTNTPIRDIPQSIQVVPQEVLQDQKVNTLTEALRNISGVTSGGSAFGTYDQLVLRGFLGSNTGNYRRNGIEFPNFVGFALNSNTDRVEVLKGPASVLFGDLAPGGIINLVTKQPLSEPFAQVEANVGSYGFYRGAIDLSGPLNPEKTLLYRLNASYEDANSFRDFINNRTFFIAPVISWQIADRTRWTVELEYRKDDRITDSGLLLPGASFERIRQLPISQLLNEPNDEFESRYLSVLSTLEHGLSDNWKIRKIFNFIDASRDFIQTTEADSLGSDGRTLERSQRASEQTVNYYFGEVDLIGNFKTGSIGHEVVVGIDYFYRNLPFTNFDGQSSFLDIEDPIYGRTTREFTVRNSATLPERRFGFFIQDLISLTDNLKILLGGRYNNALLQQSNRLTNQLVRDQTVEDFSPRLGMIYQPANWLSLYASYSRSFQINSGVDATGNPFDPTFSTQYEVGAKTEFLNGALGASLAFFKINRSNVLTPDPNSSRFSVQTGEQESQGIELDVTGRITPNWSIIASYSYLDAKITEDNRFPIGNRLPTASPHRFSLWTKYDFDGSLRGLSLGGGVFYVGERWDSLTNNYQLPGYVTVDFLMAYRLNNPDLTVQLNLKNLFNERYYDGTFGDVYPGAPRSVVGSIVYRF
ncbi:TonB-dependent siderophore receptor [Myxacorys almedinensis]|uniref:TonB-dependent siderophore receptor n=1 Tax=Myxacorys almedinensis A TaxID=2690445 RepID=A0A8J7Z4X8_9CYAN|nr:TonB-dependent siderophore receptor [Myxacorys almedinensis]NDJ17921.1 TonB-dependent siderophore receptor [Myxacorys almedinensis A]